jgi:hypothetical protein
MGCTSSSAAAAIEGTPSEWSSHAQKLRLDVSSNRSVGKVCIVCAEGGRDSFSHRSHGTYHSEQDVAGSDGRPEQPVLATTEAQESVTKQQESEATVCTPPVEESAKAVKATGLDAGAKELETVQLTEIIETSHHSSKQIVNSVETATIQCGGEPNEEAGYTPSTAKQGKESGKSSVEQHMMEEEEQGAQQFQSIEMPQSSVFATKAKLWGGNEKLQLPSKRTPVREIEQSTRPISEIRRKFNSPNGGHTKSPSTRHRTVKMTTTWPPSSPCNNSFVSSSENNDEPAVQQGGDDPNEQAETSHEVNESFVKHTCVGDIDACLVDENTATVETTKPVGRAEEPVDLSLTKVIEGSAHSEQYENSNETAKTAVQRDDDPIEQTESNNEAVNKQCAEQTCADDSVLSLDAYSIVSEELIEEEDVVEEKDVFDEETVEEEDIVDDEEVIEEESVEEEVVEEELFEEEVEEARNVEDVPFFVSTTAGIDDRAVEESVDELGLTLENRIKQRNLVSRKQLQKGIPRRLITTETYWLR